MYRRVWHKGVGPVGLGPTGPLGPGVEVKWTQLWKSVCLAGTIACLKDFEPNALAMNRSFLPQLGQISLELYPTAPSSLKREWLSVPMMQSICIEFPADFCQWLPFRVYRRLVVQCNCVNFCQVDSITCQCALAIFASGLPPWGRRGPCPSCCRRNKHTT